MKRAIMIEERDNVATATSDIEPGEEVEVISPSGEVAMRVRASEAIPFGHKLALRDIAPGEDMVKYGERIGVASRSIGAGCWVHTHNLESLVRPTDCGGAP